MIFAIQQQWFSQGHRGLLSFGLTVRMPSEADGALNGESCVEGRQSAEVDGTRTVTERQYRCGDNGNGNGKGDGDGDGNGNGNGNGNGIVVDIYESSAQIELLFEGQWNGDPSN